MKNRKHRVELIVELIRKNAISSQEELAQKLREHGCLVTQATLSRDLKMLKTSKVPTNRGTYIYVLPEYDKVANVDKDSSYSSDVAGILSVAISGNIAVIKTRNGYAAGLAYDIDRSMIPEIIGTIPGADTIFAILKENVPHPRISEIFANFLPPSSNVQFL